jgi:hypothetical protein
MRSPRIPASSTVVLWSSSLDGWGSRDAGSPGERAARPRSALRLFAELNQTAEPMGATRHGR